MAINSQETTDDEDFTEGSAYDPYYGDFEITNDNRLNSPYSDQFDYEDETHGLVGSQGRKNDHRDFFYGSPNDDFDISKIDIEIEERVEEHVHERDDTNSILEVPFYEDYAQVTDEDVKILLNSINSNSKDLNKINSNNGSKMDNTNSGFSPTNENFSQVNLNSNPEHTKNSTNNKNILTDFINIFQEFIHGENSLMYLGIMAGFSLIFLCIMGCICRRQIKGYQRAKREAEEEVEYY